MPKVFQLKNANLHSATSIIKGYTLKQGVPVSCEVRIYNRNTGILLSNVRSDVNGRYQAFGVNGLNYVLAIDPDNEMNISVHDRIG